MSHPSTSNIEIHVGELYGKHIEQQFDSKKEAVAWIDEVGSDTFTYKKRGGEDSENEEVQF